jgi:hypothetical protein
MSSLSIATAGLPPVCPEIAITSDDRRMLTTATVVVRALKPLIM